MARMKVAQKSGEQVLWKLLASKKIPLLGNFEQQNCFSFRCVVRLLVPPCKRLKLILAVMKGKSARTMFELAFLDVCKPFRKTRSC
jgi:hypothetical protein